MALVESLHNYGIYISVMKDCENCSKLYMKSTVLNFLEDNNKLKNRIYQEMIFKKI